MPPSVSATPMSGHNHRLSMNTCNVTFSGKPAGCDLNNHDRGFNTQLSAIRAAVERGVS